MVAVQYETVKQPNEPDTRDEWQLKDQLKTEQETQVNLLKEVRKYEAQLESYKSKEKENKQKALEKTLRQLQEEAGLTDITGSGIILRLAPLFGDIVPGQPAPVLSPQTLQHLVNELHTNGAEAIMIGDQRIVVTSSIRDVNGRTSINNVPLGTMPIEIKVLAVDNQKLYDRMKGSNVFDYFAIDNIELTMSEPSKNIIIQAYERPIRLTHMEAVGIEEGGK
nr:DUF881 domain-containing protein [Bacillus sp. 165]